MDHFVGLDVSVKETSVCIVDDTGRIVKEVKAASEPQALLKVLGNPAHRFKRIGLEAGPLSQWLFSGLAEAGSEMSAGVILFITSTCRSPAPGVRNMHKIVSTRRDRRVYGEELGWSIKNAKQRSTKRATQ